MTAAVYADNIRNVKPLGRWAMVFEEHETDRPGCTATPPEPRRCVCANGCSACEGTGYRRCGKPAMAYIGSVAVCSEHWRGQIEGVVTLRKWFDLREDERMGTVP